jgi:hypothetical protein
LARIELTQRLAEDIVLLEEAGLGGDVRLVIPDYISRNELSSVIEDILGRKTALERINYKDMSSHASRRLIVLGVHINKDNEYTTAWWENPTDERQGKLLRLVEDEGGKQLVEVPLAHRAGGAAIAIVPGHEPLVVRLQRDGSRVNAVYNSGELAGDNAWTFNPLLGEAAYQEAEPVYHPNWVDKERSREDSPYVEAIAKDKDLEVTYAINQKTLGNYKLTSLDEQRFIDFFRSTIHHNMVSSGEFKGDWEAFQAYLDEGGELLISNTTVLDILTGEEVTLNKAAIKKMTFLITHLNPNDRTAFPGESFPNHLELRYSLIAGQGQLEFDLAHDPHTGELYALTKMLPDKTKNPWIIMNGLTVPATILMMDDKLMMESTEPASSGGRAISYMLGGKRWWIGSMRKSGHFFTRNSNRLLFYLDLANFKSLQSCSGRNFLPQLKG